MSSTTSIGQFSDLPPKLFFAKVVSWLQDKEPEFCAALATRCALRAMVAHVEVGTDHGDHVLLMSFRAVQSAYAWLINGDEAARVITRRAYESANAAATHVMSSGRQSIATYPSGDAAWSIAESNFQWGTMRTLEEGAQAFEIVDPHSGQDWYIREFQRDALTLESTADAHSVFETELFNSKTLSPATSLAFVGFLHYLETKSSVWAFWKEWYEGFDAASPLEREIQRQIASIEDHVWLNGVSAVSSEISKLLAQAELDARISDILQTKQSRRAIVPRHGIGGNNPPENMQIEPQIVRETTIIWAAVDDLKAETEKDAPDKSAVLRIIETLGRALKAILAWLAQKGDLSVDTLIKWGIPLGGAAVLANPKLVTDVIEAAKAWVVFLP